MAETSASSSLYSYGSDYTTAGHGSSMQNAYSTHQQLSFSDDTKATSTSPSPDAILEKKRKNASAQAAFRARRSTYIANLEETVTGLEAFIKQLQNTCRDAHDDAAELRQENIRLKALIVGFEERERIWKAYAKATAGTPAAAAATSQLSGANRHHGISHPLLETPQSSTGSLQEHSTSSTSYGEDTVFGDDNYVFGKADECDIDGVPVGPGMQQQQPVSLQMYRSSAHSTAVTTSPTPMMSFSLDHSDPASASSSGHLSGMPPTPSSSADCNFGGLSSMSYSSTDAPSYCVDPNMPPPSYPYSSYTTTTNSDFDSRNSQNRSLDPLKLESSADSLTNAFITFDSPVQEPSSPSTTKESSRTRARRHTYSAFPAAPPSGRTTARNAKAARLGNDPATASNTLAVIKAQAFGNVRKTRARAKKNPTSGEAAKAALELLEARGLGLGLDIAGGVKRRKRGDLPGESRA